MIRNFFHDTVVYMIPTIITYGANLFLVPLYTRILNPSDYGVIDLIKIFGSFISVSIALEISQALSRFYAEGKTQEEKKIISSTALWFTIFCYSIFLLISNIFSKPLAQILFNKPNLEIYFRYGIGFIFLNGIFQLTYIQLRYELRSKDYAVVSILNFITTAIFSVLFAYLMNLRLQGMLMALIIGNFVGLLFMFWKLKGSYCFSFSLVRLREMLKFSIPLVASSIVVIANGYIDRLMINKFLSLNEVGLFGVGSRIASIVSIMLVGFISSVTPLVYQNYKEKNAPDDIASIFRYYIFVGFIFYLFLSLFAKELLWLLTTPSYYQANSVVPLLVLSILISQIYMFSPGIGIAKKTHYIMIISSFGITLNIILNYILLQKLGILGASIATLCSQSLILIIYINIGQKFYRIPYEWGNILISFLLISLLIIPSFLIESSSILIILLKISLLSLGMLILFFLKIIKTNEVIKVFEVFKLAFSYLLAYRKKTRH